MGTGLITNVFRTAQNPFAVLSAMGHLYNVSPGTGIGTTVAGTTTLANTTPTFHLDIPSGITCIPVSISLQQAGTVAGGAITVIMEVDNADRYTSGGTAMGVLNANTGISRVFTDLNSALAFYSTIGSAITATNAFGVEIWSPLVGQDVSPAEGITNELVYTPPAGAPEFIQGPAGLLIYTNASTTAPTWFGRFKIAAFKTADL